MERAICLGAAEVCTFPRNATERVNVDNIMVPRSGSVVVVLLLQRRFLVSVSPTS